MRQQLWEREGIHTDPYTDKTSLETSKLQNQYKKLLAQIGWCSAENQGFYRCEASQIRQLQ